MHKCCYGDVGPQIRWKLRILVTLFETFAMTGEISGTFPLHEITAYTPVLTKALLRSYLESFGYVVDISQCWLYQQGLWKYPTLYNSSEFSTSLEWEETITYHIYEKLQTEKYIFDREFGTIQVFPDMLQHVQYLCPPLQILNTLDIEHS